MIKVAVVGTGGISKSHIEGYLRFPERCKITALADRFPERSEEIKKQYNLDCVVTGDPHELAKRDDVDLVSICTPPATHAPLSVAFLDAGKNVLLEKPMAGSLEECDAILDAAKRSGKLLSVVAQNRFRTHHMRVKKILESGILGDIKHVQVNSFWWRALAYYALDWRGTWDSEGGGCTLNHSVHHIDLMLWLVGMPFELRSIIDNLAHNNSEVEDISMTLLKFKPHALGQLTSSVIHYGEEQLITIQAEKAAVAMPWKVMAFNAKENGFPAGNNEELIKQINDMYEGLPEVEHVAHAGQIDDVLTALETSGQPLITGQDGKNAINVIVGIYKSHFENAPVTVPLSKDDPFYTRQGMLSHVSKFHEKTTSVSGFGDSSIVVGSINNK